MVSGHLHRNGWDNVIVITEDGQPASLWDGNVKNLVYDVDSMSWVAQTGGSGSGTEVDVTNFPASYASTQSGTWNTRRENALVTVPYDRIDVTYPSSTSEAYAYKASGVTVATVTVTYTDVTKEYVTSVVRS